MTRDEKVKKVAELEEVLQQAKGIYVADYKGMTVEVVSELRNRCRKANVRMEVAKNTLLRIAAKNTGNEELIPSLAGPTALVTSEEDEVTPARILVDFKREFKFPEVRGGLIEGKALDENEVKVISALPSRDQLIGILAGVFQAPLRDLASVLTAPLRDLASVLDEVAKQKEA